MNIFSKKTKNILKFIISFFLLFSASIAWADLEAGDILLEDYGSFQGDIVSAINSNDSSKALALYVDMIVKVSFGIASILAVALIIWGGIEYISSESFAKKGDGKDKLLRAFGALTILFASFIFFQQVNPEILKSRFSPANVKTENLQGLSDISVGREPGEYEQYNTEMRKDGYGCSQPLNSKERCLSFKEKLKGTEVHKDGCKKFGEIYVICWKWKEDEQPIIDGP